jgi:paxillin
MSSSLGSNLSELDRLLLELNAVQHNPPGFPAGRIRPQVTCWLLDPWRAQELKSFSLSFSPR